MYTYSKLLDDVNYLAHYGVDTGSIGASEYGNMIPYIHVGDYESPQILITAAIHAREHVTALLTMRMVYAQLNAVVPIRGGVYYVPMLNPDGNILIDRGASAFGASATYLLELNGGSQNFDLWKANARGVDLNTNFNARWGTGVQNINYPAPANYIGPYPDSESETRAIIDFTRRVHPKITLSYHALGQEIYWEFYQKPPYLERDRRFAQFVQGKTGYRLVDGALGSAGGYKDWCIQHQNVPALTLEIVSPSFSHPLPDGAIESDYEVNKNLPREILNYIHQGGLKL